MLKKLMKVRMGINNDSITVGETIYSCYWIWYGYNNKHEGNFVQMDKS